LHQASTGGFIIFEYYKIRSVAFRGSAGSELSKDSPIETVRNLERFETSGRITNAILGTERSSSGSGYWPVQFAR
jgi:hypothetical protein